MIITFHDLIVDDLEACKRCTSWTWLDMLRPRDHALYRKGIRNVHVISWSDIWTNYVHTFRRYNIFFRCWNFCLTSLQSLAATVSTARTPLLRLLFVRLWEALLAWGYLWKMKNVNLYWRIHARWHHQVVIAAPIILLATLQSVLYFISTLLSCKVGK
jgi:hypothetical protein